MYITFKRPLPWVDLDPLMIPPPGGDAVARVGPEERILFLLNYTDASANIMFSSSYVDALIDESMGQELALRQVKILRT